MKYLVRVHIKDEYYDKDSDRYKFILHIELTSFSKIFEIYLEDISYVFDNINQFEKVLIEES